MRQIELTRHNTRVIYTVLDDDDRVIIRTSDRTVALHYAQVCESQ